MEKYEVGEVFTISEADNEEQEVEVVGTLTESGNEYIAVSFVEDLHQDDNNDIDVFYLRNDPDGFLSAIESDEEFEKVARAFEKMMKDENQE
ncbi:DUF1292 domain-containing protein [Heyndrickxia camelliae]|uniref:DUF1292 domain-containing protein n=1 Tax=Heyndrickxia camelliae TaxID=1707093 RepID=A0A2N3LFK8_9BACI|nr:DUF1292 domain-containing protein [Heyndrickxia camelliae]PKR83401.1 DUF1292 domain-containing protein [Heyndrickxia camelliae]